jgi:hypothetical protein
LRSRSDSSHLYGHTVVKVQTNNLRTFPLIPHASDESQCVVSSERIAERLVRRLSLCCRTGLIVLKQSLIKKSDNSTLIFLGLIE